MRDAIERIAGFARVVARSRVYETAPIGGPEQPDYLNAAVLVEWDGTPLELLDRLQAIELALGRVRTVRYGPRMIDLDILWIDGQCVDSERLTVPHPRLLERAFALVPLLEVAPNAYVLPSGMIEDPRLRFTSETLD